MLELRLLGPLTLSVEGDEHDLGGARQRVVLATLALNANRVVPVERLVDAVWGSSPPDTARAQIQICVSGLRKALAAAGDTARIRTRVPGYLLEIAEENLDVARFGGLVAAARGQVEADRVSEAVATLRSALSLWRGPALAGMYSELLRRSATQLEDARVNTIMERIRLELTLGRHEEVVGELFALVKDYPLRERLHEQLMLALYRSGRQAEALEVCRRARATFMDELGIELGESARRLESAILNQDATLDVTVSGVDSHVAPATVEPTVVVPRGLPASISDFTGRQAQLAEIRQALGNGEQDAQTPGYGTRIVSISGKGGVGKSTLAVRAAHELRDAYPDGQLYADLASAGSEDRVRAVLARFLRALGVDGNTIPDDVEERGELYRSIVADKKVLVLLDGAVAEDQVLPLLPAGPECAVIVTGRARLSGLPGARQIGLDVFDVDPSLEMLTAIVGPARLRVEPDAALELVKLCGGLPLAIRVAGSRLTSRSHWQIDVLVTRLRDTMRRLDELSYRGLVLRSTISQSYQSLSSDAQRLFRRFALIDTPDFPGWTAAALLDTNPFDALEVLESLVDAQLLDTVQYPGERLRYRFHDLIRVYATERLHDEESAIGRGRAAERLVGAWLARAEYAHRKEYGGDYTIVHGTAPRWPGTRELEGIDDMGGQFEWLASERRSLVSAVHLAADYELSEACWDLALTSVTLFQLAGYFDEWRETAERALTAAETAGNRRGEAAMLYSLGSMHSHQTRLGEAERHFTTALEIFEQEGDEHGYALALRNLATLERLHDRGTATMPKYERALAGLRRVGDKVGQAHVLQHMAKVCIDDEDTDRARELLETALAYSQGAQCRRSEAQILSRFAELHLATDQLEQAHRMLERALLIVRGISDRIGETHVLYQLGAARRRSGQLDQAETALRHALSVAQQVGERIVAGNAHRALGEIALARGRSAAGADHVDAALTLFTELGATISRAKVLMLRASIHRSRGEDGPAARDLGQAIESLGTVESTEAARLREELRQNKERAGLRDLPEPRPDTTSK